MVSTADLTQVVSTVTSIASTIALVFVTGWYAYKTNTIANIMCKESALTHRPYAVIEEIKPLDTTILKDEDGTLVDTGRLFKIQIKVKNIGKFPMKYKFGVKNLVNENQIVEADKKEGIEYPVFPDQFSRITLKIPAVMTQVYTHYDIVCRFSIRIEYWTIDLQQHQYFYSAVCEVKQNFHHLFETAVIDVQAN